MCMFTAPVRRVFGTRVFVTELANGWQFTVYKNFLTRAIGHDRVAMILPFYNPKRVITPQTKMMWPMDTYGTFFDECAAYFAPKFRSEYKPEGSSKSSAAPVLPVHACGNYNYSVVASYLDFMHLDYSRFGLQAPSPSFLYRLLKYYGNDYGFLVYVYTKDGEMPPVAYMHPMLPNGQLFIPTMHIHRGDKEEYKGDWDHEIYILNNATRFEWERQIGRLPVYNSTVAGVDDVYYNDLRAVNYNDERTHFDLTRLPPGFPSRMGVNDKRSFVCLTINGRQSNGDLNIMSYPSIERCIDEHKCTFSMTRDNYTLQPRWNCYTCFPIKNGEKSSECLCQACAVKHRALNHDIEQHTSKGVIIGTCFCDSDLLPKELPDLHSYHPSVLDVVD